MMPSGPTRKRELAYLVLASLLIFALAFASAYTILSCPPSPGWLIAELGPNTPSAQPHKQALTKIFLMASLAMTLSVIPAVFGFLYSPFDKRGRAMLIPIAFGLTCFLLLFTDIPTETVIFRSFVAAAVTLAVFLLVVLIGKLLPES